ncbi:MAG: Holliday junction branch migration protein RuvA [bacterium]
MIISLKGVLTHKGNGYAVVETAGVGYQVFLSSDALAELPGGAEVALWTHEHVREELRDLYGFRSQRERGLFLKLLDVSGVGPKMALNIMSLGRVEETERHIEESDVDWISRVPGVGKKTAQKIILELKGRLVQPGPADSSGGEIVSALVNLGYSREQASQAAAQSGDGPVEERLKTALKALAR